MDKKSRGLVMGKLYLKNKDYERAEISFNEHLDMNPEDVAALKPLAQVFEHEKKFDKAFEMYERYYLAEPADRNGVLLDICRILLRNEIWLEHVDYRKWLSLAIKAFPSNPIVVDCKALMATLPSGRKSPLREIRKAPNDDALVKVLEKLNSIELRLVTIEEKICAVNFSVNTSDSKPTRQLESAKKASGEVVSNTCDKLNVESPFKNTCDTSIGNVAAPSQAKDFSLKPASIILPNLKPPPPSTTATAATTPTLATSTASPFSFSINLFADGMKKLNLPTEGPWPQSKVDLSSSPFSFSKASEEYANDNNDLKDGDAVPSTKSPIQSSFDASFGKNATPSPAVDFSLKPANILFPNQSAATSTASRFGFPTNLFADSMKKLNLPTEGPWPQNKVDLSSSPFSFSKANEEYANDNNDHNDDGCVPNVDLPIENTCDMKPIDIKTGEEDEDILFEHRCKLFRLREKEYKERGLGSIKVLKNKFTGKGRLIMRREAIGLVCLNCWDCATIERVRDNQVRWVGLDASDGDPEATVFLIKFKTKETTDTFISYLNALFSGDSSLASAPPSKNTTAAARSEVAADEQPEIELVDPRLDPTLVDKARQHQLPDLFYHQLKNQGPCSGCNGCDDDD